jgi:flagellar export protein FliJ
MDAAPPHRFRLERVRALRERSEDQAKQVLADSLARDAAAQSSVAEAAARIGSAQAALASAATDAAVMRARQAYLELSEANHRATIEQRNGTTRLVEASRAKLVEAARARQSMDRLRDRSLAAHQLQNGRREQATLDEIALNSFRRRPAA